MAKHRHFASPHPEWVDFPNNLPPGTKIDGMNRDHLHIQPQAGLDIDELDDVKSDGEVITLRRYRQSGSKVRLPVLLYMHGGGFVKGGLETDDQMCRQIALQIPILVFSIEYRLAPEHPFPTGFEDCLNVIRWLIMPSTQDNLNIDLTQGFILGGTSAGGNFTAGLAHAILEQSLNSQPSGLLFMAPSFCHPSVRPENYKPLIKSIEEIHDAPGLTIKSIQYFAEKYAAPPEDKRYSPLLYPSRKGLAKKAVFQICGWDPRRRDEAILYRELLEEEGTQTWGKVYEGLPHGFWTTCPELEVSREAIGDTIEGVRWLLS